MIHKNAPTILPKWIKATPPEGVKCDFKIGDKVTFTNDYGVVFEGLTVIGYEENPENGRSIYLDSLAWWLAKKPASLKKEVQ